MTGFMATPSWIALAGWVGLSVVFFASSFRAPGRGTSSRETGATRTFSQELVPRPGARNLE